MNNLLSTVKQIKLDNGLLIKFIDDQYSSEYYANLTVNFGSNDLEFNDGKIRNVSEGIAHFLEHVMFHKDGSDYFDDFSNLYASANAYTTYNQTSYLFSCNSNFFKNLFVLHEMVTTLKTNKKLVDKEREIIAQELTMYTQIPDEQLENLSNTISTATNYKYDIGGDLDSIEKIDLESLKLVFDSFYNYDNMVLYVCGDFRDIDLKKEVSSIFNIKYNNKEIKKSSPKDIQKFKSEKLNLNNNIELEMQKLVFRLEDDLSTSEVIYLKSFINGVFSDINSKFTKLINDLIINESFYAYVSFKPNFNTINFIIYDIKVDFYTVLKDLISCIDDNLIKLGHKKLIADEIRSTNNNVSFIKKIAHKDYESYNVDDYFEKLTDDLVTMNLDIKNYTLAKIAKGL